MSKFHILSAAIVIGFFSLAFSNPDFFEWAPDKKLSFSDFKAPVPKNAAGTVNLTTNTTYQIRQVQGKPPEMTILNLIDRNASWIKVKKPEILALQQIKFDRCELNTRKIRKEMQAMNKKGIVDKQKYIDVIVKMVNDFDRKESRVLLDDQPHLIKIMQKDILDSLKTYQAFAK